MDPLDTQDLQRVLDENYLATFCTTNPNGTIQAVPIWYRYDGDVFWVLTGLDQRKTKNLRSDPRVSLSIVRNKTEDLPSAAALVYGSATIHEWTLDEIKAKGAWIFAKYADEAGIRERLDPIPDGVACILEIKADKTISWRP
jgi:general stress protein 26